MAFGIIIPHRLRRKNASSSTSEVSLFVSCAFGQLRWSDAGPRQIFRFLPDIRKEQVPQVRGAVIRRTLRAAPVLWHSALLPPARRQIQAALEGLDRWDWDVFAFQRAAPGHTLKIAAWSVIVCPDLDILPQISGERPERYDAASGS